MLAMAITAACMPNVSTIRAAEPKSEWRTLPLIKDGKVDPNWMHVGWGGMVVDDGVLRTDYVMTALMAGGLFALAREAGWSTAAQLGLLAGIAALLALASWCWLSGPVFEQLMEFLIWPISPERRSTGTQQGKSPKRRWRRCKRPANAMKDRGMPCITAMKSRFQTRVIQPMGPARFTHWQTLPARPKKPANGER